MLDLVVFVVLAVVLPVVINKTTESGHFHWIKPHLRAIWTAILAFFSVYVLYKPAAQEIVMHLHTRWPGLQGYILASLTGAAMLCAYWWLTGRMLTPPHAGSAQTSKSGVIAEEKPPTLLDLFLKTDFSNTLKIADADRLALQRKDDNSTLKIRTQIYADFGAKVQFVGFYVPSSPHTFDACMSLVPAVTSTIENAQKQLYVSSGYRGEQNTLKELVFSGRVMLYHEDFLSITQKAEIIKAYSAKGYDVNFRGPDYLGDQVIAWHHQHDAKAGK